MTPSLESTIAEFYGMMETSRARLQFEAQSVAPIFVAGSVLPGDRKIGADNLKALNDGKVRSHRRGSRRGVLPVAGPCFDHHQVLDR